jgi:ankyrin repeat protein
MRLTPFFAFAILASNLPASAKIKVDFEKDIQPLLEEKCYSCHGAEVQQAGLRLDSRQPALRGGDYGPVIIPGDSAGSKLIRRVVSGDGGLQMPPTGPLTESEIALLRAWIDQGAEFRIQVQENSPAKPVDPKVAAFIAAVRGTDIKAVEKLIAADPGIVNARDHAGSTPLHHAAGFSTLAMVTLLLDNGADPNAANRQKSIPLFWAIHDEAKVRLLIDRGADIKIKLVDGRTPVYQAAMLGNGVPVLRLLLQKGAEPDVKTITGMTPLMEAASRSRVEAMRLLIDKGADAKASNAAGRTVLMMAASTGSTEAVRLLLGKGADPNAMSKRKETALAAAATTGVEHTVKLLLDYGAKVDIPDDRGYTALLYAAGSDAIPAGVVKLLLAKGASQEFKGDGETAGMLAAKRGNTDVARLLGVREQDHPSFGAALGAEGNSKGRSIGDAVSTALVLLEKQSYNFIRIGGCNSCHAQDLPSAAAALARMRGLSAPKEIPQLPQHMQPSTPERLMDLAFVIPGAGPTALAWELFDRSMNQVPADRYTDAAVRFIKAMQTPEGNWYTVPQNRRPPMTAGAFQTAALAVYALKHYGPPAEEDTRKAVARTGAWLEAAKPSTTQDRVFHLLGLAWADGSQTAIKSAAKALAAMQRSDGGWSQLPTLDSDAYATGEALYALNVAGKMSTSDPVYRKGTDYLLRTQAPDGSWHVKSRSIWLQPYFESGFPYGHDQWISAAGSAWAAMALSLSAEPKVITRNPSRN